MKMKVTIGAVVFLKAGVYQPILGDERAQLLHLFRRGMELPDGLTAHEYRPETGEVNWRKITPDEVEWGDRPKGRKEDR